MRHRFRPACVAMFVAAATACGGGSASAVDARPDDGVISDDAPHDAPADVSTLTGTLFDDIWGWGGATQGGKDGTVYVVTRTDDPIPAEPGTLRYGIENPADDSPRWIVFASATFPPGVKTPIYLSATLRPHSNTTIDGRGAYVSLRKYAYTAGSTWSLPGSDTGACTSDSVCECDSAGTGTFSGAMIFLKSVHDVILTHLDFQHIYVDREVPDALAYDKQCFGDDISIGNLSGEQGDHAYYNIVINASDFRDCGDECIGITRATTLSSPKADLTISRNQFISNDDKFLAMYKGILLGGLATTTDENIRASVFFNRFVGVRERQPRVESANAHVYNNVYEDWRAIAIQVHDNTHVTAQQNVFRAITRTDRAWLLVGTVDANLWVGPGSTSDAAVTGDPASPPAPLPCDTDPSFPCVDEPHIIDVSSMTYANALATLRGLAGFESDATNDVCPYPCQ